MMEVNTESQVGIEAQLEVVSNLKAQLRLLHTQRHNLETQINTEIDKLQNMCTHDYVQTDDGDYHRPSYYYVCKICNHFTRSH